MQRPFTGGVFPPHDDLFAKGEPFDREELLTVPNRFGRPVEHQQPLASLVDEASRLRPYSPPFKFTSFFSPEDTLLCMCASEAALAHARKPGEKTRRSRSSLRIAELTTGSGLIGLHLLRVEQGSSLLAFDVDPVAITTAQKNARILQVHSRARFHCVDLWSDATGETLAGYSPHLLVCNPPYIPEPQSGRLDIEAGAGADGTAHLMRTIEIAETIQPRAMALSWCSLSDPARIVKEAESAGYILNSLFIVLIADGEYSGFVHKYLRDLPNAYINESDETRSALAQDGSARFGYLLIAGDFSLAGPVRVRTTGSDAAVARICEEFASNGIAALVNPIAPIPVRTWILDRWDEVRLRASLHGEVSSPSTTFA